MSSRTRLFFALLPDVVTRVHLSGSARELTLTERACAVAPDNLHITLAFVGDESDGDIDTWRDTGGRLRLRHCAIVLDSLEYWHTSQAIVLAVQNNPLELADQTNALREAVAAQVSDGRDERPWRAHVTLARKVAQASVLPAISPIAWVSQSFALLRSDRGGEQSVYTVVDSWSLLDKT